MVSRPSKSLAAADSEDVDRLIRIGLSEDPRTALEVYIKDHKEKEIRCREVLSGFFQTTSERQERLSRRLITKHDRLTEEYQRALAGLPEDQRGSPPNSVQKLQSRLDTLSGLVEAACYARLAAAERCFGSGMDAHRHALQAEIVESDVDFVLHLFSRHRLSPEQITHLIAIKADQFSMLKFLMPGFPGPLEGQPEDSEAEPRGTWGIPVQPGGGPEMGAPADLVEEAARVAIVGTYEEAS